MSESTRGLDRRTFLTGAAALGAAALLKPALAFAEPTAADKLAEADAVRARIVDMQAQLDVVTEQYRSTSTRPLSRPSPTPRRA